MWDELLDYCLAKPGAWQDEPWGDGIVAKVGPKIFAFLRAVGPGVWNGWKRQLLSDLYDAAEEVLRLGHKQRGRTERITMKRAELAAELGWSRARFGAYAKRFRDSYWIAENGDILEKNARLIAAADASQRQLSIASQAEISSPRWPRACGTCSG